MLFTVLPVAEDTKTLTSHPTIIEIYKEAQKQRNKYNKSTKIYRTKFWKIHVTFL